MPGQGIQLTAGAKVRITPDDGAFPAFTCLVSEDGERLYLYGQFATYWNEEEHSYDDVNGQVVQVYWRFFEPDHVECIEAGPPARLLYTGTWQYVP